MKTTLKSDDCKHVIPNGNDAYRRLVIIIITRSRMTVQKTEVLICRVALMLSLRYSAIEISAGCSEIGSQLEII